MEIAEFSEVKSHAPTQSLAVAECSARPLIDQKFLQQEQSQRALLSQFIKQQMVEGTDYGKIPGTENKSLLKPGAEKLVTLFRCVPVFKIENQIEDWDRGLFYYRFSCQILTQESRMVVAEGVGSCSSYESRYRYRNADRACPICGHAAIVKSKFPPKDNPRAKPGWYCFNKKGGCGANFDANDSAIVDQKTGRIQNPDILDCVNTVLKMAKKRALVDASISLGRCSDIFTQDIEDFAPDVEPEPVQTPAPRQQQRPQQQAQQPQQPPQPQPQQQQPQPEKPAEIAPQREPGQDPTEPGEEPCTMEQRETLSKVMHACGRTWRGADTIQRVSKIINRELPENATFGMLTVAECNLVIEKMEEALAKKKEKQLQKAN